jgi:hypothetical protein
MHILARTRSLDRRALTPVPLLKASAQFPCGGPLVSHIRPRDGTGIIAPAPGSFRTRETNLTARSLSEKGPRSRRLLPCPALPPSLISASAFPYDPEAKRLLR